MSNNQGHVGTTAEQSYAVANQLAYGGGILPLPADSPRQPMQLGTQPLGICSLGGNRFAFVGYFEPCIYIGELRDDQFMEIEVIRWAQYGDQLHRIFPPNAQPGGANRAQTVNPGPEGTLIVSCNASRTFYVLAPPSQPDGHWSFVRQFDLPEYPTDSEYRHVHSAYFNFGESQLLVTTSIGDLSKPWEVGIYAIGPDLQPEYVSHRELSMSYVYGIGFWLGDIEPWFVTDSRFDGAHGIFRGQQLIVPGISGNGICFMADGSALVTRYGQEYRQNRKARFSFGGNPGSLNRISAAKIQAGLDHYANHPGE